METNIYSFYCLVVFNMCLNKGMALRGRVCTNESSGLVRCCIHFFANDAGECEECPNGTTSDGTECKTCPESYFGRRCATKCDCLPEQTCNPINGCVLASATKTLLPGEDLNIGQVPTSTTNSTIDVNISPSNKTNNLYYISLGVVLVSAIIVSMFLHKVRKKCKKPKTIDDVKEPPLESPYGVSYYTTGYHYLDESKMVDNVDGNVLVSVPNTKNLDMGTVKTGAEQNDNSGRDSYLHPYQSMRTAADIHQYNSCVTSNDVSSNAKEEYLNPYNPLLNQNKDDHKYLKCKAVNDKVSTFRLSIPDCTENDYTPTPNLHSNLNEIRYEKNGSYAEMK